MCLLQDRIPKSTHSFTVTQSLHFTSAACKLQLSRGPEEVPVLTHLAIDAGTGKGTWGHEAAACNETHTNAAAGSSTTSYSGSIDQVGEQCDQEACSNLDLACISEVLTMSAVHALSKQACCEQLIFGHAADSIGHVCIILCDHSHNWHIGMQGYAHTSNHRHSLSLLDTAICKRMSVTAHATKPLCCPSRQFSHVQSNPSMHSKAP